jgi:hypothetical protein
MDSCEQVKEVLLASARREPVGPAAENLLREHVQSCAECRLRLENERGLSEGLAALATCSGKPGPAVKAAVMAEFRRQRKVTPLRRPLLRWTGIAAAAAALVATVFWVREHPLERPAVVVKAVVKPPRIAVTQPVLVEAPVVASAKIVRPKRQPRVKPARPEPEPEVATEFFEIPYVEPLRPDERADVFRIQMPRAGMAMFGVPVTGGRLDSRIQADVVLGEDGVARAIRFIR